MTSSLLLVNIVLSDLVLLSGQPELLLVVSANMGMASGHK